MDIAVDLLVIDMVRAYRASDQWFQRDLPLVWRMPEKTIEAIAKRYGQMEPDTKISLVGNSFMGIPIEISDKDEVILALKVV